MGILGVQLVISLIAFSFLQKLSRFYSFGLWILSRRLIRYLHPTNDQLKTLAGISTNKRNRRNVNNTTQNEKESFTVPRNIPLELDTAEVTDIDLVSLKFYPEFQWLMDYSVCAVVVYVLTEIALYMDVIKVEYNLSVMWCMLAMGFCIRVLLMQLVMYVKTEEGGERILCFAFALFFLVAAMAILVVDQDYLEFGLEDGYKNFSESANVFMLQQGYLNQGPVSINTFKIILAILSAILGTLLTFPGLRFAKTYLDSLKYAKELPLKQMILHMNFILPLVYLLLWVKPIARDLLCLNKNPVFNEETFDMLRLGVGLFMCLLRLTLLTSHLQSHLNLAYEKITRMRKESGRISSTELKKMVARVSYYLCIVAIQYVAPLLLTLFMILLLKTLGGYSWFDMFSVSRRNDLNVSNVTESKESVVVDDESAENSTSILDTAAELTTTLGNLRKLFTPVWYRGLLSFVGWWLNAAWFTCTLFGLAYYGKLNE